MNIYSLFGHIGINNKERSVKLTLEVENDSTTLPFVDILIKKVNNICETCL